MLFSWGITSFPIFPLICPFSLCSFCVPCPLRAMPKTTLPIFTCSWPFLFPFCPPLLSSSSSFFEYVFSPLFFLIQSPKKFSPSVLPPHRWRGLISAFVFFPRQPVLNFLSFCFFLFDYSLFDLFFFMCWFAFSGKSFDFVLFLVVCFSGPFFPPRLFFFFPERPTVGSKAAAQFSICCVGLLSVSFVVPSVLNRSNYCLMTTFSALSPQIFRPAGFFLTALLSALPPFS